MVIELDPLWWGRAVQRKPRIRLNISRTADETREGGFPDLATGTACPISGVARAPPPGSFSTGRSLIHAGGGSEAEKKKKMPAGPHLAGLLMGKARPGRGTEAHAAGAANGKAMQVRRTSAAWQRPLQEEAQRVDMAAPGRFQRSMVVVETSSCPVYDRRRTSWQPGTGVGGIRVVASWSTRDRRLIPRPARATRLMSVRNGAKAKCGR